MYPTAPANRHPSAVSTRIKCNVIASKHRKNNDNSSRLLSTCGKSRRKNLFSHYKLNVDSKRLRRVWELRRRNRDGNSKEKRENILSILFFISCSFLWKKWWIPFLTHSNKVLYTKFHHVQNIVGWNPLREMISSFPAATLLARWLSVEWSEASADAECSFTLLVSISWPATIGADSSIANTFKPATCLFYPLVGNSALSSLCVTTWCSWSNLYTVLIRLSLCFPPQPPIPPIIYQTDSHPMMTVAF